MKVTPIKSFPHDRRGMLVAGRPYEFADAEAARLLKLGLVRVCSPDEYETKVVTSTPVAPSVPSLADGEAQPSSASPAAQVLPQTTAKPSDGGGLTYPIDLKLKENPMSPEEAMRVAAEQLEAKGKKRGRPPKNRGA